MKVKIGDRIKELRTINYLTQKDLSDILKISPSTVGMYEQNRREPDSDTLDKLAEYFNISVDYLLGRTNEKNPTKTENRDIYDIKVALFGGDTEVTDEMWDEVKKFAEYIKHKNNK